jgi:hypothetical protein
MAASGEGPLVDWNVDGFYDEKVLNEFSETRISLALILRVSL